MFLSMHTNGDESFQINEIICALTFAIFPMHAKEKKITKIFLTTPSLIDILLYLAKGRRGLASL